jgi:hypothetical protein
MISFERQSYLFKRFATLTISITKSTDVQQYGLDLDLPDQLSHLVMQFEMGAGCCQPLFSSVKDIP